MPAVITHDRFGREALKHPATSFVATKDERDAFLLGNQGPDPLFYSVISPSLATYHALGSLMHDKKPAELLSAFSHAIKTAPTATQPVIRAYAAGFLCHYLLDRTAHPLIYAQEYALCDAGVEGLSRKDGSEVHAVIETELDELMLYTYTGKTIASFAPHKDILQASDQALASLSYIVGAVLWETYERIAPVDLLSKSVHNFRRIQHMLYSPRGKKRAVLGKIERAVRPHSFLESMSHQNRALTYSDFDNHKHDVWVNPFTGDISTASFMDLFNSTLEESDTWIPKMASGQLSLEEAQTLTQSKNFSGKPTELELEA